VLGIFLKAVQHQRSHPGGAEHVGGVVRFVKKEAAGEHFGPVGDAQPEGRHMPRIRDDVEHGGEALEQGIEASRPTGIADGCVRCGGHVDRELPSDKHVLKLLPGGLVEVPRQALEGPVGPQEPVRGLGFDEGNVAWRHVPEQPEPAASV
jgi:hypothetical protein